MPEALLARADVDESIRFQAVDDLLRVRPGEAFKLKFAYRLYETSRQEDRWTFRLHSDAGDGPKLVESDHIDRPMIRQALWSFLAQEHRIDDPGDHTIRFTAQVETTRRPWNSREAATTTVEEHEGTIRIVVG